MVPHPQMVSGTKGAKSQPGLLINVLEVIPERSRSFYGQVKVI